MPRVDQIAGSVRVEFEGTTASLVIPRTNSVAEGCGSGGGGSVYAGDTVCPQHTGFSSVEHLLGEEMSLTINLVAGQGAPPLRFGMSKAEARDALSIWGTPEEEDSVSTTRLRVRDPQLTRDIFAHFERDERLTAIELWRPEPGDTVVNVMFGELDLFSGPAEEIMGQLRSQGIAVDQSDPFFPSCPEIALGFNRDGGDDRDDRGLSRYFESVLIAPPGYYN